MIKYVINCILTHVFIWSTQCISNSQVEHTEPTPRFHDAIMPRSWTLTRLAEANGLKSDPATLRRIAALNDLRNIHHVRAGARIRLPRSGQSTEIYPPIQASQPSLLLSLITSAIPTFIYSRIRRLRYGTRQSMRKDSARKNGAGSGPRSKYSQSKTKSDDPHSKESEANSREERDRQKKDRSYQVHCPRMTTDHALKILGFSSSGPMPTLRQAREARRRLSHDFHPDIGGSLEKMQELNSAFSYISPYLNP